MKIYISFLFGLFSLTVFGQSGFNPPKSVSNVLLDGGSSLVINNPTVVGGISNINAYNNSTININGLAGSSSRLTAMNQATITHNGGNASNIIKQMTGTLTTGNFNQTNLIMISPTSRTLTGANTNRSEYLGVVSSVPLF